MEWKSLWETSCHLAWSWRNKERHGVDFVTPVAPVLLVMQNGKSYELADKALRSKSKSSQVEHSLP